MAVKCLLRETKTELMRDSLGFSSGCAQFAMHQHVSLPCPQLLICRQDVPFDARVHDVSDCS